MPPLAQSINEFHTAAGSASDADMQALWLTVGLAVAALGVLIPLRLMMKRRRLLTDTPTSKTAGVTLGLGELKGRAEKLAQLTSFLAGMEVVHYTYTIEEHWRRTVTETTTDSNGRTSTSTRVESGWTTVDSGQDRVPFWLRDDSGRIRVLPDGAKMEPRNVFYRRCTPFDPLYYGKGPACAVADSTHERLFKEEAILPGDTLYVLGQVRAREDVAEPEVAADPHAEMFLISTRSEDQIVSGYGWLIALWGFLAFACAFAMPLPQDMMHGVDFGPACQHQYPWILAALFTQSLLVGGLYAAGLFNGLIRLRERVRRAWAMVEVELQRRADLIPNLADAVKAYGAHEQATQAALAKMRATPCAPAANHVPTGAQVQSGADAARAQQEAATRLLAVAERYPELKASPLYQKLMQNLVETETRLAMGRDFFNASVELHNARLLRFPDNLFTRLGRFATIPYYEAPAGQKGAVAVKV